MILIKCFDILNSHINIRRCLTMDKNIVNEPNEDNENIGLEEELEDDDIIEDAVFYGYENNCDFGNLDE
jgi:hypothetical protein